VAMRRTARAARPSPDRRRNAPRRGPTALRRSPRCPWGDRARPRREFAAGARAAAWFAGCPGGGLSGWGAARLKLSPNLFSPASQCSSKCFRTPSGRPRPRRAPVLSMRTFPARITVKGTRSAPFDELVPGLVIRAETVPGGRFGRDPFDFDPHRDPRSAPGRRYSSGSAAEHPWCCPLGRCRPGSAPGGRRCAQPEHRSRSRVRRESCSSACSTACRPRTIDYGPPASPGAAGPSDRAGPPAALARDPKSSIHLHLLPQPAPSFPGSNHVPHCSRSGLLASAVGLSLLRPFFWQSMLPRARNRAVPAAPPIVHPVLCLVGRSAARGARPICCARELRPARQRHRSWLVREPSDANAGPRLIPLAAPTTHRAPHLPIGSLSLRGLRCLLPGANSR